MCLLVVLQAEYLQQHSLPCKLPRLPQKLFPPFLCFAYPFLGTQMSAVVTYCREASGSDGCHKGGGSCWRHSASSVMQTPLLNSHFLGTYIPVWLTFKQAKSQTQQMGWVAGNQDAVNVHCLGVESQIASQEYPSNCPSRSYVTTAQRYAMNSQLWTSIFRNSSICRQKTYNNAALQLTTLGRNPGRNHDGEARPAEEYLSSHEGAVMIPSGVTEDFYTRRGKQ